ncbi:MAG: glutamate racemase [Nitrospirota bacterium]|nr:glutamate racemase [Nitrospirota bacterium]
MSGPVGIFDSGVGGLTVLKELVRRLPHEEMIYLGDTARVPYGIRSPEVVTRYCMENTAFLLKAGIKLLVVACNTASSLSLDALRAGFSIPMIGVLAPGAKAAVEASRGGRIGVIGTSGTINSGAYAREIQRLDPGAEVISQACPLFVPLAEEGWVDDEVADAVAARYLAPLREAGVDALVLGCTHYPLLKGAIRRVMGEEVVLIDSAVETALEVERTLKQEGIASAASRAGARRFCVTDIPDRFRVIGERFLGIELDKVEQVDVVH